MHEATGKAKKQRRHKKLGDKAANNSQDRSEKDKE